RSYVKILPVKKAGLVRVSGGLASSMGLGRSALLRATFKTSSQTISVGPVIGVIMSRASPQDTNRPFGDTTTFCRELVEAAKKEGVFVYFFTPAEIGTSHSSIDGWTYDRGWKKGTYPMPDVLHNRLTSRKYENL